MRCVTPKVVLAIRQKGRQALVALAKLWPIKMPENALNGGSILQPVGLVLQEVAKRLTDFVSTGQCRIVVTTNAREGYLCVLRQLSHQSVSTLYIRLLRDA